jgi:hypothetical protein
MISSGLNLSIAEPTVPQTNFLVAPANSSAVRGTTTILAWEASIDGNTWAPIGSSSHLFYWSEGIVGSGVTVYDRALEIACGHVNGGTNVPLLLTQGIESGISYNPGILPGQNLLDAYSPNSAGLQCADNAALLQFLLRTLGSPSGAMVAYWGGTQNRVYLYKQSSNSPSVDVSFKSNRPPVDNLPANQHFKYHVVVKIGNVYYDPSYGTIDPLGAVYTPPNVALQQGSWTDFTAALQNYLDTGIVYQEGGK